MANAGIRLYPKFYDAPGEAKPDWWIIAQLAKKMGYEGFDWKDSNEVLEEGSRTLLARVAQGLLHGQGRGPSKKARRCTRSSASSAPTAFRGPVLMLADGSLTLEETKRLHDVNRKSCPSDGPAGGNTFFNKKLTHGSTSQTGKCNLQKAPWSPVLGATGNG